MPLCTLTTILSPKVLKTLAPCVDFAPIYLSSTGFTILLASLYLLSNLDPTVLILIIPGILSISLPSTLSFNMLRKTPAPGYSFQVLSLFLWVEKDSTEISTIKPFWGISQVTQWLKKKKITCQCRRHKRCRFNPWVRKMPWSRKWQPTPIFFPGKFHGHRAWWATIHGIANIWTQLSTCTHTHTHTHIILKPDFWLQLTTTQKSLNLLFTWHSCTSSLRSISFIGLFGVKGSLVPWLVSSGEFCFCVVCFSFVVKIFAPQASS